jgi:hypothetical protein
MEFHERRSDVQRLVQPATGSPRERRECDAILAVYRLSGRSPTDIEIAHKLAITLAAYQQLPGGAERT